MVSIFPRFLQCRWRGNDPLPPTRSPQAAPGAAFSLLLWLAGFLRLLPRALGAGHLMRPLHWHLLSLCALSAPTSPLFQQALYSCVLSLLSLSIFAFIRSSLAQPKAVSDLIQLDGRLGQPASPRAERTATAESDSRERGLPLRQLFPTLGGH